MQKLFIPLLFFFSFQLDAQVDYYSADVRNCVEEYKMRVDSLIKSGQVEDGLRIFEAGPDCIIGKTMPNYEFSDLSGHIEKLENISRPIILKMSSSWCQPCLAEIPAINRIADEFEEDIKVIVLLWDEPAKLEELAKKYSDKVTLVHRPGKAKEKNLNFRSFKHYLGFPASYYLDRNKKIVAVKRGAAAPGAEDENGKIMSLEEANQINYERFLEKVREML